MTEPYKSLPYAFLQGGGEMGALIRAFTWTETPIGPVDAWPQSLRTTLGIVLHSAFPMFLFWGDNLLCFYNDAYRPSLGTNGKHPALGKPAKDVWPEIWDFIGPLINQVLTTGEPVWFDDQLVPIYRNGRLEDVYWTFSYSPVYGDGGQINGVLVTCTETTEKVANVKKLQVSSDELSFAIDAAELGIWDLNPQTNTFRGNTRLKDWFGLQPDDEIALPLFLAAITDTDRQRVINAIDRALQYELREKHDIEYTIIHPTTGQQRVVRAKGNVQFNDQQVAIRFNGTLQDITEQKNAEQTLKASEARFQGAIAAVQGILWTNNAIGEMEGEQPGWGALTGQQYDDYRGYGWAKVVHPDDAQPTIDAWQEALRERKPFVFEHRVRLRNGDWGLFAIRAIPLLKPDGSIHEWVGVHTDITRSRQAEESLRESEAELAFAIDAAELGIWDLNPQTNTFRGNTRLKDWFGLQPDDEIDLPLAIAVMAETDRSRVTAAIGRALQYESGGHYDIEYAIIQPTTGQQRVVRAKGKAQFNGQRVATRFNGTLQDITEQYRTQQRIEESQQQLLALFEQSPAGIAIISEDDLTFRMANQFYGQLVGRRPQDIIDKPLLEALPELRGQGFDELLRQVIRTGIPYVANEVSVDLIRHNQLETIYVDLAYQPRREADSNRVSGVLVIATDVTQQVRSRRRVEDSEAKLQSIVSTAPVAIGLFMGRDLVIELPNQTFIDIVGKGPAIAGKPLREVMPELITENQPFLQILDDVYTSGKMFQSSGSMVQIVQNGVMTYNYYNITYTPLFNEAGDVYAILDIAVDVTDQIKAQEEIAQQKLHLQNALDIANLGTFTIDLTTFSGTYSDSLQRWFGVNYAQGPMNTIMDRIHPDDRPLVERVLGEALQSEERSRHDVTYRILNETEGDIHVRSLGKANYVDGRPETFVGVLQNVTPQVLARQALEQSEKNLRNLVENAPFPIGVYVGREMRIQLANQTILTIWGKGSDVVGKRYAEVLPELADQHVYEQLDGVYTTGIPFHAKNQRVDLVINGLLQPFYFNYSFTPLYDAEGQVYGVMNTAADVTDLAVAKQQVDEAEATLRGAIELAELGTWELNVATGQIIYSDRIKTWFGFDRSDVSLNRVYDPIHENDRDRVQVAIRKALQPGNGGMYDEEYRLIHYTTGDERIIHAQGLTYFDEQGQPVKITGTAQDVTEQRRLQQELERQVVERTHQLQNSIQDLRRSNDNLQQFAYIASHDLQEPLRKIQSFGNLLENQYAGQLGEGVDHLHRMQSAASRMSVLIRDLLTFSRISTRQDASARVGLAEVVQAVLNDLDLTIQERNAQVSVEPLPTVQGDKTQLGQLFQNLLSNALKFRRPAVTPRIQIRAERVAAGDLPPTVKPARLADLYHRIDVIDNGIGFDQKYLDRIFQVFQRLHGRNEFAGTGIGLAICEKVAANHGGAITATSKPGEGATFSVFFPDVSSTK